MRLFNKLQYIILYVLGFVIIGTTSFITGDIGLDSFKTASYYIDNILTYVAIICIIIATLFRMIDNFEQTNEDYKDCTQTISNFARSKTYIPSIFSRFCDALNEKRKEKQFLHNTKKALWKLDKKATDEDFRIWNKGTEEEKIKNTYCKKRQILEEKLKEDWYKTNLPNLEIDYDRITSGLILGGYFSEEENNQVNDFITKHKTTKIAKDKLATLLFGFGLSSFASSLALSFEFSTTGLMNVVIKCMMLFWHTFTTLRYAEDWNKQVTLKDIRFRKGVIQEYEKWIIQEASKQNNESKDTIKEEV